MDTAEVADKSDVDKRTGVFKKKMFLSHCESVFNFSFLKLLVIIIIICVCVCVCVGGGGGRGG